MKKIILVLLSIFCLFTVSVKADEEPLLTTSNNQKINVYLFRGEGCSHCYDALTYFYENNEELSEKINVITYEVWYNSNNEQLLYKVQDKFELDESTSVPFILVGDMYHEAGFSSTGAEEILATVDELIASNNYTDVVEDILTEEDINAKSMTLEEACIAEGIIVVPMSSLQKVLIISTVILLVGGCVALVYFSRKK